MKKLYAFLAIITTIVTFAQAPQGFNYQATVRNSAGALIVNQNVNFKFNIMLNSATSLPIFSETHLAPTDDLGQVNLVIGQGTATTGSFSTINWSTGNYYLGIELNTGNGYVAMGTTQLLSVPYALYANSAGSSQSQGKTSIYLTGDITNAEAAARIASELGPETENIYIRNTTQLTSVDLSSMSSAVNIEIEYNEALTSVNLNGLITIYNNLLLRYNPILTSILFNNLAVSECIRINNNNSLSSISLNSLLKVNKISYSAGLIGIEISDNINLQSVLLPLLSQSHSIEIYNNSLLTLDLPSLTKVSGGSIYVGNNKLSSTSVNSLLNKFLTVLPSSGKNIYLQGQNPPAPPTGQGVIDKQTLINAGNQVYTDGFVPTLTTTAVTSITTTSATSGGTITNSGGSIITAKGVVWSTSNDPNIEYGYQGMTTDGSGDGSFTSNLVGLTLGTTYYVRAYATNEIGIGYGQVETFTTLTILPTLTTAVSSITNTSAIAGGIISSNGGASITARGVCWSTITNPTIALTTKTTDGTGIGVFTSNITGLTGNTTYYVRAYATNSVGTGYGNEISFTTPPINLPGPNLTDIDGNTYQSVTNCGLTFTKQNLNVSKYTDGTPIPQVTDPTAWANLTTGAWCYFNNTTANGTTYGKLYNWYAVVGIYDTASANNPALRKKLAPTGWHVPTDAEWTQLTDCLGGGSVAGGKMKSTGTSLWQSPNTAATNESGFTGLPGDHRSFNGQFMDIGSSATWWSSSDYSLADALFRYLNYYDGTANRSFIGKTNGLSVRCIKD
jgi:uncharacterized protein (TIGR02145 family)